MPPPETSRIVVVWGIIWPKLKILAKKDPELTLLSQINLNGALLFLELKTKEDYFPLQVQWLKTNTSKLYWRRHKMAPTKTRAIQQWWKTRAV